KAGIINKSGAWFSYNDEKIGQGRDNAKAYLEEHPDVFDEVEQKTRAYFGLPSGNGANAAAAAPAADEKPKKARKKDADRDIEIIDTEE
ncbi:MAG: hypothetical protein J6Z38_01455, partial [Lachnospiraceae bacterium]|nr:hypothetical protein [Lachnospiraceae bacterium]